ncbi:MAG: VPLPA-CTERM sorting domain-containing protein [Gammaproteobacteria bacterium]|nr:VPLPA-CTERM sorting domain-containing protein [Gammaproteobacteria bacterium]
MPAVPVPIPAAIWLFGTVLIGFVGISRRRKVA